AGHVARRFPASPGREGRDRRGAAVEARAAGVSRRTPLPRPAINAARHVLFLIAGAEKARAVAAALRDPASTLPAARVRPRDGVLTWLLDRAAAAALERPATT